MVAMGDEQDKVAPQTSMEVRNNLRGALVPKQDDPVGSLLSFFRPDEVGRAVQKIGWNVARELEIFARIAESEEVSPWQQMAAAKYIKERVKEAALMTGRMESITKEMEMTHESGARARLSSHTMRLLEEDFPEERDLADQVVLELGEGDVRVLPPKEIEDDGDYDGDDGEGEFGDAEIEQAISDLKSESDDDGELSEQLAAGVGETYTFREGHTPPSKDAGIGLARPDKVHLNRAAPVARSRVEEEVPDVPVGS